MIDKPVPYLITAGGLIKCRRCKAQSSRTKLQCGRPALKDKNVCQFHGGRSTGPKTEEGKNRIRAAHWKHGKETKEARKRRSQGNLRMIRLEDMGRDVGMFKGPKRRGRKPNGYYDK
jgi:hypothetical protein